MRKRLVLAIIIATTAIGGLIRFADIGNTPAGLNVDEVAIGYDAYSILKTGKDTRGLFMPVSFPSLEDYKPPIYIYLTSIMIALFGLNEFSVRLTSAFFGTLAIPLVFLLANKIFRNEKIGIFSMFFLAISPWHIFYSRIVSESQVAMVLVMSGFFALMRYREGNRLWGYLSISLLVSSMYAYHSERLFIPLFLLMWVYFNKNWLLKIKKEVIPLFLFGTVLFLPLIFDIFFGKGGTRANQESVYNDINFLRQVFVSPVNNITPFKLFYGFFNQEWNLATFFVIRKYFSFFQPDFLFFHALPILKTELYGLGVMYIFQAPILLIGVIKSFSLKSNSKYLLLPWFFLGLLPASVTLAEHHTIRTLIIVPVLAIISGVGLLTILNWFSQIKNGFVKAIVILSTLFITTVNLLQAFLMFNVHFPVQKSDTFMVGNKEAIAWIKENKNIKEIVFDPRRLTDGQIIISVPYLYYLFYTNYDPKAFQDQLQNHSTNPLKIKNLTFREIDWVKDYNKKDVVFIGDPFFIPEKDFRQEQILKKIYSKNEKPVLFIVNPSYAH